MPGGEDLQRLLRVADARDEAPLTPTVLSSSSSMAATPWRASAAGERQAGDAATHDHGIVAGLAAAAPAAAETGIRAAGKPVPWELVAVGEGGALVARSWRLMARLALTNSGPVVLLGLEASAARRRRGRRHCFLARGPFVQARMRGAAFRSIWNSSATWADSSSRTPLGSKK